MRRFFQIGLMTIAVGILGCTKKNDQSFALEGSKIRFVTVDFGDPSILVKTSKFEIRRSQILEKSSVLQRLDVHEYQVLTGLAYLAMMEKIAASAADKIGNGAIQIYLPKTEMNLETILGAFEKNPAVGYPVEYRKSQDPNLLASFKELEVMRDEIEMQHGLLQSIEQQRFDETLRQIQKTVSQSLLAQVAAQESKPLEAYIQEKVLGGKNLVVTESDVKDHLEKLGKRNENLTSEERHVLALILRQEKEQMLIESYVAERLLSEPVKTSVQVPNTNLHLSTEWQPVAGYKDAPVSVVAFVGSTCSDCPAILSFLSEMMLLHDGYLKLNLIHSFEPNDHVARSFAEFALCVESIHTRSSLRFMTEMAGRGRVGDESKIYEWARLNSVDEAELRQCISEKRNAALVRQHLDYSRKVGLIAVPTLWVDGRLFDGKLKIPEIKKYILEKIEDSGENWFGAFIRRVKALIQT